MKMNIFIKTLCLLLINLIFNVGFNQVEVEWTPILDMDMAGEEEVEEVEEVNKTTTIGGIQITINNYDGRFFRNGDQIPLATNMFQWMSLCNKLSPACCYKDFASQDVFGYGLYYNWFAVNDIRDITPQGFHIPNGDEIDTLIAHTNSLTARSKIGWGDNSNNSSGLNIIPSGYIHGIYNSKFTLMESANFDPVGAHLWTSGGTPYRNPKNQIPSALGWHLYRDEGTWGDYFGEMSRATEGYSIRLIRD